MDSFFARVTFRPVREIEHKVHAATDFGHAVALPGFDAFIDGLPPVLAGADLRTLIDGMRSAKAAGKPIMWAMGAHSIKCGLTPWLLALAREGYMTSLAVNGAAIIHDLELALTGETSEDVGSHLDGGLFGSADEPGRMVGGVLSAHAGQGRGLGELVCALLGGDDIPRRDLSLLGGLGRLRIPVTVHAALGTDTAHFHPAMDWGLLGSALQADFQRFVELVASLDGGGAYLNVGSAVVLPEVFLKALTVARNLGTPMTDFLTANLDMIQHYRPRENVCRRPGGRWVALTGHHELLIPLLGCALLSGPGGSDAGPAPDQGAGA